MSMFLVMTREVINKFRRGTKLTHREKIICLRIIARTFESWERVATPLVLELPNSNFD
jgi:hypothetical protein